ncbi:hypothetical protein EBZ37_08985 [bacterium]|nr:hypothetical protein [bacterium]
MNSKRYFERETLHEVAQYSIGLRSSPALPLYSRLILSLCFASQKDFCARRARLQWLDSSFRHLEGADPGQGSLARRRGFKELTKHQVAKLFESEADVRFPQTL